MVHEEISQEERRETIRQFYRSKQRWWWWRAFTHIVTNCTFYIIICVLFCLFCLVIIHVKVMLYRHTTIWHCILTRGVRHLVETRTRFINQWFTDLIYDLRTWFMIYNSDLRIDFPDNYWIVEVFRYFKYIYMEFNRIHQSGMIVIYDLHPRSVWDLQRCRTPRLTR